jgi:PKD repeat protein
MAAPIAGFTGAPYYGEVPLTVQFTDLSTGLPTSWLWTYGDGETGAGQSPTHTYADVGGYDVTLDATNVDGTGTLSMSDAITAYRMVSASVAPAVRLIPPSVKYCSSFTCMGWVKDPIFGTSGSSLIPLAISDGSGDVRGSAEALYFEISQDTGDYRLAFKGSKSMLIRSATGINIADGLWHMFAWVADDAGYITYYVDGISFPAQSGLGPDGVLWSRPHTTVVRAGEGYVWVPCLDEAGQSMTLFNWRYASGLVIHAAWVSELMALDRASLGI